MINIKPIVIYVLCIIFFSCSISSEKHKEFYPNGNLKILAEKKDDVLNGKYKIFYKDGSLKFETNYISDTINGDAIWYYKNGNIKASLFYRMGSKNGIMKTYYENGSLESEQKWYNDQRYGKSYFYYKDGSYKEYLHYSVNGKLIYKLDYSVNGNIIKEEGSPFIDIFSLNDRKIFRKGKEYNIFINVAFPPNSNPIIKYGEIDTISKDFKSSYMEYFYNEKDSGFIYPITKDTPGIFHWKIEYEQNFPDSSNRKTNRIFIDTDIGYVDPNG